MGEEKDLLSALILELRRGTLTISVLSQMAEPKYGYALVQSLEAKGGRHRPQHAVSAAPQAGEPGTFGEQMGDRGREAQKILSAHSLRPGDLRPVEGLLDPSVRRGGAAVEGGRGMKPQDQELMRRYIYQVLRRVPKGNGTRRGWSWRELIGDMYADKGSMEETLTQLGDPAEFARQYQKGSQYLIGPEYLETYLWFVKVVLLCTGIPILAVALVQAMVFTGQDQMSALIGGIVEGLRTGIPDALVSCVTAFGAVTLVFAVMERQRCSSSSGRWAVVVGTADGAAQGGGRPLDPPRFLAPVPDKKARISRGDSIVGIVFLVILCVLLVFAPQFFAAVITEGEGANCAGLQSGRWGKHSAGVCAQPAGGPGR